MLLPLIVFVGATIRFVGIGRDSLWFDELQTVWVTRLPMQYFMTGLAEWGDVPLYYVIGRFWFSLYSVEAWSRSLSWAAGVCLIIIVYFVGKELFSRQTGLWAAALVAVSPFLVWYSRDATLYSWLAASSLLSTYFLVRCVTRGRRANWIAYTAITAATLFTHLFTAMLLVAQLPLYLIIRDRKKNPLAPWIASQAVLTATMIITWLIARGSTNMIEMSFTAEEIIVWFLEAPIILIGGAYAIELHVKLHDDNALFNLLFYLVSIFFILDIAGSVFVMARNQSPELKVVYKRAIGLILYTFLLVALPIIVFSVAGEIFVWPYRFYLWATPTLLLLLALIIVPVKGNNRTIIGILAVTGLAAITLLGPGPPTNMDYRGPLKAITDGYREGDYLFCFPYAQCAVSLGYYLPEDTRMGGGRISPADSHNPEVAILPERDDWFDYFLHQKMRASTEKLMPLAELSGKADRALQGVDRVWLMFDYGPECIGCEEMKRFLLPGWHEIKSWHNETNIIYLYTR